MLWKGNKIMTKGLLIVTLVVFILLMICPIITTLIVSKDEKNKEVFNSIIKGVLVVDVIALIILSSLWITPLKNKDLTFKKVTTTTAAEETDELSEAGFNELGINEYLELVKGSEKSIILIARPTCYYCQQFTPVLKEAKEDMNLTINYLNTDKLTQDDWSKFQESLEYLQSDEWGTPLTLIVQSGKLLDKNNGYTDLDTIKTFFSDNGF